jgi:hypothetical protein
MPIDQKVKMGIGGTGTRIAREGRKGGSIVVWSRTRIGRDVEREMGAEGMKMMGGVVRRNNMVGMGRGEGQRRAGMRVVRHLKVGQ